MAKKSDKPNGAKSKLDGEEALRSVGVGLYALHYRLADLDPNEWYAEWREIVDELFVYSGILGEIHKVAKEELATKIIQLPQGVYSVTVPNPFYEGKRKEPNEDHSGSNSSIDGLFPF